MSGIAPQPRVIFGAFEVNTASGELRKNGVRIKLHEKPFQLLVTLLQHPGEVVDRKQLQERLWPGQPFLEFENGLNNAIGRLRGALGDTAEKPRFIETIPRRGYRFLPEVSEAASHTQAAPSFRRWLLILAVSAAVLTIGALAYFFARPSSAAVQSIAVLPFRNLGTGTADDYFAAGMTDAVTTDLAELGVSKVVSETSVSGFKGTKETIPQIARALGVDALVEGAVLREGDTVRITVQLIRADTDRHIWADSYERQLTNILELQNQIAHDVVSAIDLKLSPAPGRIASPPRQVKASAYQAYLEGNYYEQEANSEFFRAKGHFEQAIQLDPSFAPAYAGLSDYYAEISRHSEPPKDSLPKAKEFADQALRVDPNLPEGHLALANFYSLDWNWNAANQEYLRAIALAPGLAPAHEWYATFLGEIGQKAQSLEEARRAVQLDPLSAHAHNALAAAAFLAGQFGESIEQCHKILELEPDGPDGYACMSQALAYAGKYSEALSYLKRGIAVTHGDPYFLSFAAITSAHLGQMQQAAQFVEEIRRDAQRQYVSPSVFAAALAAMGKEKQAMDELEVSYKNHDTSIEDLKIDPIWDPLRRDPRFQALLHRMNFPD